MNYLRLLGDEWFAKHEDRSPDDVMVIYVRGKEVTYAMRNHRSRTTVPTSLDFQGIHVRYLLLILDSVSPEVVESARAVTVHPDATLVRIDC